MSLDSLVFVAIVGVWAVYLVPQWFRRRHEIGQAQKAASTAARVLAPRRRPVESRGSTRPVLHPQRSSSGAVPAALCRSGTATATLTAPGPTSTASSEDVETTELPVVPVPPPSPRRDGERPVENRKVAAPTKLRRAAEGRRPVRPPRSVREVSARAAARRRARVLLVLVASTVLGWGLVVGGLVTWPAGVPANVLLVLDLAALRAAARRRQRSAGPRLSRPAVEPVRRREPVAPPQVSAEPVAPVAEVPAPVQERPAVMASVGWTPVPVPPPMYTLKPPAPRPDPRERPVAIADPVPAVAEDDLAPMGVATLDLDAVLDRRRAVNG